MPVIYNYETIEKRTAKKKKEAIREIVANNKKAKLALTEQARRSKKGLYWD